MTDRQIQNSWNSSETNRLNLIQTAARIFAFVLNLSALTICLYLLKNFREQALNSSQLFSALSFISAFLVVSGLLFLTWGWIERRKIETESRSFLDDRTGALAEKAFEKILTEELRRAGRYHYPVTLCLLGLDDFESFTQNFGG